MGLRAVFRSAIDDGQGQVDAGYLAIAVALIAFLLAILGMVVIAGIVAWVSPDHHFDASSLGTGIGAASTGFGAVVAAVGAFRWGDKDHVAR